MFQEDDEAYIHLSIGDEDAMGCKTHSSRRASNFVLQEGLSSVFEENWEGNVPSEDCDLLQSV